MAQSILIFDFGVNEDAAQQARHKVEAWKQGFRLGNKMLLKFEREDSSDGKPVTSEPPMAEPSKAAGSKGNKKKAGGKATAKSGGKASSKAVGEEREENESPAVAAAANVRLLVRLDFSDHEKLSHQRWLDRIPVEEPFKSASGQAIRAGDPEFAKTAEHFDSLD